jgi:hypothetical protein
MKSSLPKALTVSATILSISARFDACAATARSVAPSRQLRRGRRDLLYIDIDQYDARLFGW